MTQEKTHVGVIGSGAWGTALAVLANRAGSMVTLWSRNSHVVESVEHQRYNDIYLPGVYIDPSIHVTGSLTEICNNDILILSVPSQSLRATCISISDLVGVDVPIVISTKGIERGSLALMSEVVQSILPDNPVAVLSGPNFAEEAARGQPTATTIACKNTRIGEMLLYALGGKLFRPYLTDDLIGTQIGGAVKNVIAIACGIAAGKGLGENARAALITRGLAEMARLCIAKGGRYETLSGLSGMGDLVLTCSSTKSRNMSLGMMLGKQMLPLESLDKASLGVVEGVASAESVTQLAQKLGVSMPICSAVAAILAQGADINQEIQELLERPFSAESVVD